MKKITDIYQEYNLMPNLQLHQLRVAGVAKQICDSLSVPIDKESIIASCLLHDMGNIIKFDLSYTERIFPEFFDIEHNFNYWKNVQEDYFKRYGTDENEATIEIARELGLSDIQIIFIRNITSHMQKDDIRTANSDLASCICKYSDMRVSPKGILSLRERLVEWQKRDSKITTEYMETTYSIFHDVETKIFNLSNITPEDINDESILGNIEILKNFEI